MCKKIIFNVFLLLIVGVLISCTTFIGEDMAPTTKKLAKPKLVTQKYVVCSSEMNPCIILKSTEKDASIYYILTTYHTLTSSDGKSSSWTEYKDGIEIKQKDDEWIYRFTIKAVAKKENFEDSDELVQEYYFDVRGGDIMTNESVNFEVDTLNSGDEVVKGVFNDKKNFSEQMRKYISFKVVDRKKQKTKYREEIKNGKFEIKLQKPLQKGDEVWLSMDTSSKIICYKKLHNDNVGYDTITLWENYYAGYTYGDLYPAIIS